MERPSDRRLRAIALAVVLTSLLPGSGWAKEKNKLPAVRWVEGNPGCTFSRSDDGKYRYGSWYDNVGVVMAVDSQELEKVHRRREMFFAVFLTVQYRGQTSLDLTTDEISL